MPPYHVWKLGRWIIAIFILCLLLLWVKLLPSISISIGASENSQVQDQGDLPKGQIVTSKGRDAGSPELSALRTKGLVKLPTKDVLKLLSDDTLDKIYHSYLDNIDILCHRKLRMGKLGDGGWEICDDEEYRPRKPCLMYSFGINNEFSFEDDVTRLYECPVFSFDPSMKVKTHQRTPLNMFLKIGIAGTNIITKGDWNLKTLDQLKKILNHTGRIIDVLKMDVEKAEWESLPQMIWSGELSHVRQLLVEYHGYVGTYQHLALLKDIYDLGFRKFYVHKNPVCVKKTDTFPVIRTYCYEIHYVNIKWASG